MFRHDWQVTRIEERFLQELDTFRSECETTSQHLYAYLAIHSYARRRLPVVRTLDRSALFWNTVLYALQTASLITLHRIFDHDSPHSIDVLMKLARQDQAMFSTAALRRRRLNRDGSAPEWLDEFMSDRYEPEPDDFRRLNKAVAKARRIYEARYKELRHLVFAHRVATEDEAVKIASKANINEFRRLISTLLSIHSALWQLFANGREPIMRKRRYAAKPPKSEETGLPHERIVVEAEQILRELSKAHRKKPGPRRGRRIAAS